MTYLDECQKVLHFINGDCIYNDNFNNYIDETIVFVASNDPYRNVFYRNIDIILKCLLQKVTNIHKMINNMDINHEEFKDLYIKSYIPFKSNEEIFYLKLLSKFCCVPIKGYTFNEILETLLTIYNKIHMDASIIDVTKKELNEEHANYDVLKKKNGIDYVRDNTVNKITISDNQDKPGEIEIVGVKGEKDYFNISKNKKDILSVWVSRDVNRFHPFDFIEYDLTEKKVNKVEVKTTTIDYEFPNLIISNNEKKELFNTFDRSNELYTVRKRLYDKNLENLQGENIVTFLNGNDYSYEGIPETKQFELGYLDDKKEYNDICSYYNVGGMILKTTINKKGI